MRTWEVDFTRLEAKSKFKKAVENRPLVLKLLPLEIVPLNLHICAIGGIFIVPTFNWLVMGEVKTREYNSIFPFFWLLLLKG